MAPYLTQNQVLIFGSIFYYANSTYVYGMHNNPSVQMNLVLNNGTMEFTVPADMNVTAISFPQGMQNGYMEILHLPSFSAHNIKVYGPKVGPGGGEVIF